MTVSPFLRGQRDCFHHVNTGCLLAGNKVESEGTNRYRRNGRSEGGRASDYSPAHTQTSVPCTEELSPMSARWPGLRALTLTRAASSLGHRPFGIRAVPAGTSSLISRGREREPTSLNTRATSPASRAP